MKDLKYLALLALSLFFALPFYGQSSDYFYGREYRSSGDTLKYRILYPKGYDKKSKKEYPLVVFLHGEDGHGSDNKKQLSSGTGVFKNEDNKNKFPAIVIFPQCPSEDKWAEYTKDAAGNYNFVGTDEDETYAAELLVKLVKYYIDKKNVDADRVYLIGNSSGAFGALDIAIRNPKLFAAVVSISGGFDAADAKKLKKVPLRMYHGTEDEVVPVALSRDFYYELKANGASKVELLEYPGFKHDILDSVLGSGDFLEWIFSKEK